MTNPFIKPQSATSIGADWQTEDRQLEYQRRLAEKMAEDNQPPQGGMVGSIYVPPAWTQMLAKALNPVLAQSRIKSLDEKQRGLAKSRMTERMETVDKFNKTLAGTPEDMNGRQYVAGNNPDEETGMGYKPAVAPDRNAALGVLAQSRDPMLQQMYMAQALKGLEVPKAEAFTLGEGQVRFGPDGKQIANVAPKPQRQEKPFIRTRVMGDQEVQEQLQADGTYQEIGRGPRFARQVAPVVNVGDGRQKAPSGYKFSADGSLTYIPGGPADPKTKTGADGMPKLTESQGKANLYQSRATESDKIISDLEGQYSPMAINAKQGVGKIWGIGGALESAANVALPKNSQKAEQAQRDFVNAILRQESGAVIADSEFANAQKQYFPQPGDAKEVIAQKKKNRETAINGLRVMAGPAVNIHPQQPAASGGFKILGVEGQ